MKTYTCYECLKVQTKEEMVPSKKIKKLSLEQSRKFKMCSNCDSRVFMSMSSNG